MKRAPQKAVRPSGQIHLDGCHTTLEILFLIKIPLLGHGVVCMYLSCNVPYIEDSNKLKRGWTWTILSLITSSWSLLLVFYDALWFCSFAHCHRWGWWSRWGRCVWWRRYRPSGMLFTGCGPLSQQIRESESKMRQSSINSGDTTTIFFAASTLQHSDKSSSAVSSSLIIFSSCSRSLQSSKIGGHAVLKLHESETAVHCSPSPGLVTKLPSSAVVAPLNVINLRGQFKSICQCNPRLFLTSSFCPI